MAQNDQVKVSAQGCHAIGLIQKHNRNPGVKPSFPYDRRK
jgi:hypothetical protein